MNRLVLVSLAASLFLLACPKNTGGPQLGGTDDEKMDQLSAQLEEYRTKTSSECSEQCDLKSKVCKLSDTVCEISGRNADRPEYQKKCVTSQEECARFNEQCSGCKK